MCRAAAYYIYIYIIGHICVRKQRYMYIVVFPLSLSAAGVRSMNGLFDLLFGGWYRVCVCVCVSVCVCGTGV